MSAIYEDVKKEAEEKAVKLSEQLGSKVTAHIITTEKGEHIVGFFKEPNRMTKMYALDMASQSLSQANDMLLNACLIKEESDHRILEDKPENDAIYLSFNMYASTLVQLYNLNLEKKS